MKNHHHIVEAAENLQQGMLVAFPTETVYGLGGNALSDKAVAHIYETKNRPDFNPLIVHVPSLDEAKRYAIFNATAEKLAEKFWPGALTLVMSRRDDCALSLLVSAGLDTVAMRVPAHSIAQELLKETGLPLAAPSANKSGHISPTDATHVREEFGNAIMVLDGGSCEVGIESTVVDVTTDTPVILRPGSITAAELEQTIGKKISAAEKGAAITSPGMLERHYAPSKPLRLNATDIKAGEALLAFGDDVPKADIVENLSTSSDLREAAANLFRMLRLLDKSGAHSIAVMPIPREGLGIAINDRLVRAATR